MYQTILLLLLQLQLGVEFEANMKMQETTTSVGYQVDLQKANLLFKGNFIRNEYGCSLLIIKASRSVSTSCGLGTVNNLGLSFCLLFSPTPCVPGTVDSNWMVGATLEKKLLPLPLTLALGAFLNQRKHKFQCGFSVTIG